MIWSMVRNVIFNITTPWPLLQVTVSIVKGPGTVKVGVNLQGVAAASLVAKVAVARVMTPRIPLVSSIRRESVTKVRTAISTILLSAGALRGARGMSQLPQLPKFQTPSMVLHTPIRNGITGISHVLDSPRVNVARVQIASLLTVL